MLTPADYNQLKLLYNSFLKCNTHIKELLKQEKFDDVDVAIQEKESLLRQIIFFEKSRIKDIKENSELNTIRLNLIELEKENIELVKATKEKLAKELSDIKKTKNVYNAYEPSLIENISTVDIKTED